MTIVVKKSRNYTLICVLKSLKVITSYLRSHCHYNFASGSVFQSNDTLNGCLPNLVQTCAFLLLIFEQEPLEETVIPKIINFIGKSMTD